MWKLTIEDDDGRRFLVDLSRDVYLIGRDQQCSLRLTDRNVSRQHAALRKHEQQWVLEDQQSYNGTYINGHRVIGGAYLRHADLIQLGDYRMYVSADASVAGGAQEPKIVAQSELRDRLVMLVGPTVGAEYNLDGNVSAITIGRAEDCGVSINHPSVSRVHAEIRPLAAGCFEIIDHGSANGIRVNGTELPRSLIEAGDLIELGDIKLRFVGRGQFFSTTADTGHAVGAYRAVGASPANSSKKWAIAAVVVLLLAIVAFVAVQATSSGEKTGQIDPTSALAIDAAKKASESGDLEGIKAKLQQVPLTSPARQSADFTALYAQWANGTIAKATKETDVATKKKLLTSVAEDPTAPAVARSQAADLLNKLDEPGNALDISQLPPVSGTGAANTGTKNPGGPNVADLAAQGGDGEAAARRALEPKVMSGKASQEEVKMLIAICRHQGDTNCVSRAKAFVK